ncbi:hypothetical protein BDZ91DRAFT_738608, partial [Kalaharituber pfeilii]
MWCPRCSYMMRLECQHRSQNVRPTSVFCPIHTGPLSAIYTTAELAFFPSSTSVLFFFSQRIPVILPRSLLSASNHFRTFP